MLEVVAWVGIVAIIFVALLQIVLLCVLIFLVLKIRSLVEAVPTRVSPVITTAEETVTTIRGTTEFVSTKLVRPLIDGLAIASAVETFFKVLFGTRRTR